MYNLIRDEIINGVKKNQSYFVTGPAGVGKTHLIKEIHEQLNNEGVNTVLTSTTGINALNLGGITVHKFFGLQIRTDMGYLSYLKSTIYWRGIVSRLKAVNVIIIDEVSMLRADTLELINSLLKLALENNEPFGGKSIIFTGDFFQIEPVIGRTEIKREQWVFKTQAWIDGKIKPILMKKIFRQTEPRFINFLQDIRIGELTKNDELIIDECKKNSVNGETTIFYSTNKECDEQNNTKLKELPGEYFTYQAEIHGKRSKKYAYEKEAIVRDCIAKKELKLKNGALVLAIVNDKNGQFANGSIGHVIECNKKNVEVLFKGSKESVIVSANTWTKQNLKGMVLASLKQIPLIPAYGLTIHKSQGLTLDSAVVDCKNIFASGQMYVALSRVRTMAGLKIVNFDKNKLIANPEVKKYYDDLEKK